MAHEPRVRAQFCDAVAQMVRDCTDGTLAYHHSLSEVFCKRGIAAAERLDAVVLQMHEGAGSSQRVGLGLN